MSNSRYRSTPANSTIGTIANTAGNSAATRSASWTAVWTPASLNTVAPTHRTPTASAGSSAATSRRAARRVAGGQEAAPIRNAWAATPATGMAMPKKTAGLPRHSNVSSLQR